MLSESRVAGQQLVYRRNEQLQTGPAVAQEQEGMELEGGAADEYEVRWFAGEGRRAAQHLWLTASRAAVGEPAIVQLWWLPPLTKATGPASPHVPRTPVSAPLPSGDGRLRALHHGHAHQLRRT